MCFDNFFNSEEFLLKMSSLLVERTVKNLQLN